MEKVNTLWSEGALLICEKCGRRDDGSQMGKDFAEDLKKEFKSRLRDAGHGKKIRVMTSSCLALCPKKSHVAAWMPTEGKAELIVFKGSSETESLYQEVLSKL